jgi:hypothetical protein
MDELYGQGMDGGGDPDTAADTGSETDQVSRSAGESNARNWQEDEEPLTRSEYADMMRRGPAVEHDDADNGDPGDDAYLQAIAKDEQEREELPEPRTRQEVAEQDQVEPEGNDPAGQDHDQNSSADLDAIITEEDKLPEPRTRQEVAEQEQSGDDPLTRTSDENPHRADGERDAGRQEDADRWPTPEERAYLHETYLDWRQEVSAGREQGTNLVGDKPDRSPDDRSDLPPTGEELIDMESDSMSRFDRLRNHIYKQADDITDVAEKTGNRALELWERPPTETHAEIPIGHPEITNPAPPALDGGQLVLASLTVGMLGYELLRAVKNRVDTWKGGSHGSK